MPNLEELPAIIFLILGIFAIVAWHRLTKSYIDFRNKKIITRNNWSFNLDSEDDIKKSFIEKYLFFKNIKTFQPLSYIQGSFDFRQFKLFEVTHSFNTNFLVLEIQNFNKTTNIEIVSKDLPSVLINHFESKLIKGELEYEVFNKEFNFFKTTKTEQFYMLSPDTMEALLNLKKQIGPFGLETNEHSILIFCNHTPYLEYLKKSKSNFDLSGAEKEKILKGFLSKILTIDKKL